MARNALPASNASVSGYRRQNKLPDEDKTALRPDCNKKFSLYTENANGWNKKPHACCPPCFRIRRSKNCQDKKTQDKKTLDSSAQEASFSDIGGIFSQVSSASTPIKVPCHHIFTKKGWRRAKFMCHPEVQISVSFSKSEHKQFGVTCRDIPASQTKRMTDPEAQSCLWAYEEFRDAGFSDKHLLPV